MDIHLVLATIAVGINALLVAYLLLYKPHTRVKLIFVFVVLQMSLWGSIHILGEFVKDAQTMVILVRFSLISLLFLPFNLLYFILNFPEKRQLSKKMFIFLVLPPLLLLPFSFTSYNADGFINTNVSYQNVSIGPLYNFFIPYFILYFSLFFILLVQKIRTEKSGVKKKQLKYVFWGLMISAFIGIVNNAILPKWFAVRPSSMNGVIFSSIFTISTTYAIMRFRFFGIHFLITRSMVYCSILFFIYFLFAALFFSIQKTSNIDLDDSFFFVVIITCILIIPVFFQKKLQKAIKNVVPKEGIDFSVVDDAPHIFDTEKNFYRIQKDTQREIRKQNPGILNTVMYIYLQPYNQWIPFHHTITKPLLSDHVIAEALMIERAVLIRSELDLDELWMKEKYRFNEEIRDDLKKVMDSMRASIIMPIWWYDREIRAFIVIRLKKKHVLTQETVNNLVNITPEFGNWLSAVIAYHYSVLRGERIHAGLSVNRD